VAAPRTTAFVLAVLVALLAVPAVRHFREQPPPPPPVLRLAFDPPPGTELGAGDAVLDAAISHDEQQVAFVATRDGTTLLWRRRLETPAAEVIAGTDGATLPAWSSTDDAIAFFAGNRLKSISLARGTIDDLADAPSPAGATWLPSGALLFSPGPGPIRALQNGEPSDATELRASDRAHVFPVSTGSGDDFVYTAIENSGRRTVRVVHVGEEHDLEVTSGHGVIVGGLLLYVRDNAIFARRLEPETMSLRGQATRIASDVGVTANGRGLFAASTRLLLTAPAASRARMLTWFDLSGTMIGSTGEPGEYWQVRLSPDDRFAAVTAVAPLLRTLDIVIVPMSPGQDTEALTLALAADSDPVWSPDGRRVVYRSLQSGRPSLFLKVAHDRSAQEERILEADATPTDWRPESMLFHEPAAASGNDIWSLDSSTQARRAVVKSGFNDFDGRWSPDGEWLAYVSDESGRPDIYANRSASGTRVRVSFAGGTHPRWTRDGRSIVFLRGSTILRATLASDSPPRFATPATVLEAEGIRDFDLAHRRDGLLALVPAGRAASTPVAAVVDWQSSLPVVP